MKENGELWLQVLKVYGLPGLAVLIVLPQLPSLLRILSKHIIDLKKLNLEEKKYINRDERNAKAALEKRARKLAGKGK